MSPLLRRRSRRYALPSLLLPYAGTLFAYRYVISDDYATDELYDDVELVIDDTNTRYEDTSRYR